MPLSLSWEVIGMLTDAAIVALLYSGYRRSCRVAECLQAAPEFEAGEHLKGVLQATDKNAIAYACVSGIAKPRKCGSALRSHYKEAEEGVMQQLTLVEHRTKRTQGYWTDHKKVLRDVTNVAPFMLVADGKTENVDGVHVREPLRADHMMDFKVTYDKFDPTKTSLMERGIDRLFGDVTKGFQETEQMLEVGAQVMGIGRVALYGGYMNLEPPEDGQKYIITKLSKSEVIKSFRSDAKFWKFFTVLTGAFGVGLFIYWAYKKFMAWKERRDMEETLAEFRAMRALEREGTNTEGDNDNEHERTCVICLAAPQEVILLDCGHICMCSGCSAALPEPRRCPVCRQNVARILPVYMT